MRKTFSSLLAGVFVTTLGTLGAQAATVGYWRMETDNDAGTGYSVPNELLGSNALIGSAGTVELTSGSGFPNPVPQTGAANLRGLNGSADINGSVASYSALNTNSITVEFFARTQEGAGDLVARGTGNAATGGGGTNTDGFRISGFSAVNVRYFVENGVGGSTLVTLTSTIDLDTPWDHIAWTYDAATGIGSLFKNGVLAASNDGADNRNLFWGAGTSNLFVGAGMDGGGISSGNLNPIFDELRISDIALPSSSFLNASIPEPATMSLLALGALAMVRRKGRMA